MSNKLAAGALVLGGLLILSVSLLANVLGQFSIFAGLGIGGDPGFGPQQALGTIIGFVVLVVGVWLWRQGAQAKFRSVRYAIASLAFAVMIGGPIYVVASRVLQQSAAVETCVEVATVPSSAEGAGQKRVGYGVRIVNTGQSTLYVDSVVLMAFRDTAESWLPQSDVVAIDDMVLWKQVDSRTYRPGAPGSWSVRAGNKSQAMRTVIVPVEQLSPLYWFGGKVFFRHRNPARPIIRNSAPNWIDNFRQECP
jgi:hypothetical protein